MPETDPTGHSPSSGGSGGNVTEAQVNAARARAAQAEQRAAQARAAADGAWEVAGQAQHEATAEAGYARYLNSQASAILREYDSAEAAARQAFAKAQSLDEHAQDLLTQASDLQRVLNFDQAVLDSDKAALAAVQGPASGGSDCSMTLTYTGTVYVASEVCSSSPVSGGAVVPGVIGLKMAISSLEETIGSLQSQISGLQGEAAALQSEADSYVKSGLGDLRWAAQLHGEYEAARAKADAAAGRARADAKRAAEDYAWATHLTQVANYEERAAAAAETQYQYLEREYQREQAQKKKQEEEKKRQQNKQPRHNQTQAHSPASGNAAAPTPTSPAPPKPPKQVKKVLQQVANVIVRVAQVIYQVGIQPIISAVGRCVSQPSAGSCLQAAASIAVSLIPALRAERAVAAVGEDATVAVIGRLPDTAVAKGWAGHEVLDIPTWTSAKNDAWVQSVIDRKMTVYVASNPTWENLWNAEEGHPTVFGCELSRLLCAGYSWDGWHLVPPGGG